MVVGGDTSASSSITKAERSSSYSATATSTSTSGSPKSKLEPHPHILYCLRLSCLTCMCKHILIRSNRRHGRKERAMHRLTNTESCRLTPPPPCPALPPPPTQPARSSWRLFFSCYSMGPRPPYTTWLVCIKQTMHL
jgi:hypothetical protein